MIKRIEFSGINGISGLRVDFTRAGLSWLYGAPASGKTTLFAVLQILQRISRGMTMTQQVFAVLPRMVGITGHAKIAIELANRIEGFRYELHVSNEGSFGAPSVVYEDLRWAPAADLARQQRLFVRDVNAVSKTGGNGVPVQYPIEPSVFALATILDPGLGLLTAFRTYLGDVLLAKPEISQMRDDVVVPGWMEGAFVDMASQLAQAFQRMPAIYAPIEFFCRKLIGGFQGIIVRDVPPYGRYLYVRKGDREFSLSMLAESEKRLLSLAFVYALGLLSAESVCVWDDFLLGLSEPWAEQCLNLISTAYANGQFIALTSFCRDRRDPVMLLNRRNGDAL